MPEENKEIKSYTFHLRCTKCAFKFSIQREHSDMNKIDITKMFCMECKKPIMWDTMMFPAGAELSTEAQGKMNIEASKMALEMATKQKQLDVQSGESEEVLVTSTQEGMSKGRTEKIPKKVIESIKEKVAPILE